MNYEKPEMQVIDFEKNVMALNITASGEPDGSNTGEYGDESGEW